MRSERALGSVLENVVGGRPLRVLRSPFLLTLVGDVCARLLRSSSNERMNDRIANGSPPMYARLGGIVAHSGPPFSHSRDVRTVHILTIPACRIINFMTERQAHRRRDVPF